MTHKPKIGNIYHDEVLKELGLINTGKKHRGFCVYHDNEGNVFLLTDMNKEKRRLMYRYDKERWDALQRREG